MSDSHDKLRFSLQFAGDSLMNDPEQQIIEMFSSIIDDSKRITNILQEYKKQLQKAIKKRDYKAGVIYMKWTASQLGSAINDLGLCKLVIITNMLNNLDQFYSKQSQ